MPSSPILELQRQYELLEMEYNHEKELFLQQADRTDLDKKVRRGICWFPLSVGRSYYNSLNQYVVEVFRTENTDVDHHFEFGRPVMFFDADTVNGQTRNLPFTGTVNYVDEDRMVVILPGPESLASLQGALRLGVQLSFDENIFKLMFASLRAVMNDKNGRLAELRDIFHGTRPAGELTFTPLRFPWLNSTQESAVNKVLRAKDVAIVHGPPGTGKTTTLVEAIYETLHRENQVLVCAQSNMAVDWISEKLVDRGIPVLRIGNPVRVNDKMLSFTYERRFEAHPDYPLLHSIRRAIRQLYDTSRKGRSESVRQKINSLRDRADELEVRIQESLFNEARVIACTLTGAASKLLFRHRFATLFIDEAAQALEAACWQQGNMQQTAPAQRMVDFTRKKLSYDLPESSYSPGLVSSPLHFWMPPFIANRLSKGFQQFGKTSHGFLTNDAVLIGVETRTSSPVRIVRDNETLQHITVQGLFPCGEGAGYAGGIVSAGIDGERCAEAVAAYFGLSVPQNRF